MEELKSQTEDVVGRAGENSEINNREWKQLWSLEIVSGNPLLEMMPKAR